ncbi:MAG: MerR family transcriptional regulator [Liquorilactobacillus satsumensis]|uniref:MerR family transcriptional regulator n=1 Tax=Lactobacillaceae TaxID=33958 RepID=UPI001E5F338F|nr:MerR family transcriptional regulator [Leuconostoc pseudomesenteroides]MCC8439801.1 hypothetical protein [Leuconostoc pseudomesenteroides]
MKIDAFSKISDISVYTLRYYDRLNILKPLRVNETNGYREYSSQQLLRVAEINSLKELGLTVKEMAHFFANEIKELRHLINQTEQQIKHIQTNLFLYNNGGINFMNGITIKHTRPFLAATLRTKYQKSSKTYDQFSENIWATLEDGIKNSGGILSSPCLTMYYSGLFLRQDDEYVDQEIVEPITSELKIDKASGISVREIPAEKVASIINNDGLENIGESGNELLKWVTENNYQISGAMREIYHMNPNDSKKLLTVELQLPIEQ